MASYIDYQSILNVALGTYRDKGFRLTEQMDNRGGLYYQGEKVCSFSPEELTITGIHQACLKCLDKGKELWD